MKIFYCAEVCVSGVDVGTSTIKKSKSV